MAKGYTGQNFWTICATCLNAYARDGLIDKKEMREIFEGHCEDCYNCIGHDKRRCA